MPRGDFGVILQGPLAQSLQQTPCKPKPHFVDWPSTRWWEVSIGSFAINSSRGLSALAQVVHPKQLSVMIFLSLFNFVV
jgi:hypothetical protein